jgi:hypothetical protein
MEKKTQYADNRKIQIMPADVRAGQVISLVEVTGGLGTAIDASRLADELGANVAVMLPILDTAELLGLVKSEKGDISLTEFGLKFQKTIKNKVRLLTDHLAKVEPFKTASEMAARYGEVTTSQVARSLAERGISWHHDPELNESLIRTLLIHWAIYARLLEYNKNGNFEPVRR